MNIITQNLRRVGFLWLIWIAAAQALPAQNFSPDNSPKVAVVKSQWYDYSPELIYSRHSLLDNYVSRPYFFNSRNETLDCYSLGLSNTCGLTREQEKQFVYQVKVRNTGEKQIAALDWEYIFINPETKKIVGHHSFHALVRIQPRQSKTLSEISVSPPTDVINVQMLAKNPEYQFIEQIVVNSIIFLDGSVWIRSKQSD